MSLRMKDSKVRPVTFSGKEYFSPALHRLPALLVIYGFIFSTMILNFIFQELHQLHKCFVLERDVLGGHVDAWLKLQGPQFAIRLADAQDNLTPSALLAASKNGTLSSQRFVDPYIFLLGPLVMPRTIKQTGIQVDRVVTSDLSFFGARSENIWIRFWCLEDTPFYSNYRNIR